MKKIFFTDYLNLLFYIHVVQDVVVFSRCCSFDSGFVYTAQHGDSSFLHPVAVVVVGLILAWHSTWKV